MLPYLFSWALFAVNCLFGARRISAVSSLLCGLFLSVMIGFRHQVGADWFNYLPYLERYSSLPFLEVLLENESGYSLLNWIGGNVGGGIYLVNFICGTIFSISLLMFCRCQPRPWLALVLAFPYLVTVVAMGYSRQGVAIGIEMIALLALQRDRLIQYLCLIILAASFHRTALVMLVLPASTLSAQLRLSQLLRLILFVGAGYGFYSAVIEPNLNYYSYVYLELEYESHGALIRVLLCLVPSLVFLSSRKSFTNDIVEQKIWSLLSIFALISFTALFFLSSSTAVDRLSLYLIPLQLFVGSRIPDTRLLGLTPPFWNQLLVVLSLVVLLVWLLGSPYSYTWLPYKSILLPNIF